MLSNILLIILVCLVGSSYLILLINWITNKNNKIDNYNGFDIAKGITSNYDEINIVSCNGLFSFYDVKRNVIRLNNKNYEGNSFVDISIGAMLAGISLVNSDNRNKFIFKRVRVISLASLIMMFLSFLVNSIGDARIMMIITFGCLLYLFMRYQMVSGAVSLIECNMDMDIYSKIKSIIMGYVNFYKISFISLLVVLVRLVVIMLGI